VVGRFRCRRKFGAGNPRRRATLSPDIVGAVEHAIMQYRT
jgi:hypothetical protein